MFYAVQYEVPETHAEKVLLAAIIRRAAYDIALYRGSRSLICKRIWEDACKWMFDNRMDYITAFKSICMLLDQNPDEIRRKTLKLRKRDVRKYDMVDPYGRISA